MRKVFSFLLILACLSPAYAADLDSFYTPLISKDQKLYTIEGEFYNAVENGHHGSASFHFFESNPQYYSLNNTIRFAPVDDVDVKLGYKNIFPIKYFRPTENNAGAVTSLQEYFIEHMMDFTLNLRWRGERGEYYFDFLEKHQKTSWSFASNQTTAPIFFNYFTGHYEDIKIGARFLAQNDITESVENLTSSSFDRPLLNSKQWNTEWELGYKNGRLDRFGIFHLADTQRRNYRHRAKHHFIPQVTLRYGLSDNMEVESGLAYTSPFSYIYEYHQYKDSGPTNFIRAVYRFNNQVAMPLKLRYRPSQNWEASVSSNFKFLSQELDAFEKEENDSITNLGKRKLGYYNIEPAFELTYVTDPKTSIQPQQDVSLIKKLLDKRQSRVSVAYKNDITVLDKNGASGTQNVLDPYNVFLYPVGNFVSGTEHAAFFSGNAANAPANVARQNYHSVSVKFEHGVTDNWEVGVGTGYHSGSAVHQFSLIDQGDRFFIFKPYYYVDLSSEWTIKDNSRLSFELHYVPSYKTLMESSVHPDDFDAETEYVQASLAYKLLF